MPPNDRPDIADLAKRVKLLEEKKVGVKDLPMNALRAKLAQQPSRPQDVLLPGSIGNELLQASAGGATPYNGTSINAYNTTWSGVATPVNILTMEAPEPGVYLAGYNADVESVEGGYFVALVQGPGGAPQGVLNDGIGSHNTIAETWPFRIAVKGEKFLFTVYMASAGRYLVQSGYLWYMRIGP